MIALSAVTAAVVMSTLSGLRHQTYLVTEVRFPTAMSAEESRTNINQCLATLRGALIASDNPERQQKLLERYSQAAKNLDEDIAELEHISTHWTNPKTRENFAELKKIYPEFERLFDTTRETILAGRIDEAKNQMFVTNAPVADKIRSLLDEMCQIQREAVKSDVQSIAQASSLMQTVILGAEAASVILGFSIAFLIIRSVTRPLAKVVESLESVAKRDLTKPALNMNTKDEIGRLAGATDSMSLELKKMVGSIQKTANQVAAAATEVAASSDQLASSIKAQEESTNQVSAAITELSSSVSEVAAKSAKSSDAARDSMKQAQAGGTLVNQTIQQLEQINSRFDEVAQVVSDLEKQGEEVSRIVQVIQDIADQTNLLALNAAIEAARAGEHGRGFAVVADEVRKLAERTTQATGEVSKTIGGMSSGTQRAGEAMKIGRKTVADGRDVGTKTGDAVAVIVKAQKDAEEMALSIAAATKEQSAATEEISRTVEQSTASNRECATAASQAAQASTELSSQAEDLKKLMDQFKV
ncbi:MAG: methyl-accepting chemotaxis protein [Phycisphaerales bacterium]|nr:methyl-accepting chemotaxis protein [Phycisphaerales bacterium]